MVRLYGIPGCGPCEIVNMKGVPFVFVDVRKDPGAARKIARLAGSPTAGVVLEVASRREHRVASRREHQEEGVSSPSEQAVEVIRSVSPAHLEAWYRRYLERRGSR
ncbi:MAG: NrdH-redoxin [Thermus sp.]